MNETNVSKDLASKGYTLLKGLNNANPLWAEVLQKYKAEFQRFHESWNDLPPDNFLSDGGHYRFRRYSVFNWSMEQNEIDLLPHEAHYQSTYRNNMNGGIYREFEPFKKSTIESPLLKSIIQYATQNISYSDEKQWRIQAHQFRIVANVDEAGLPTPEGVHRDDADFILSMVLGRENITGGVSHIYDDAKRLVFGGILSEAGDAVIVDDRQVWHGVSEVYPMDDSRKGHRDVLVLTFHNKEFS